MSSNHEQEMSQEALRVAMDAALAPLKAQDPAEAAQNGSTTDKSKKKKKGKNKGKGVARRGETALNKYRGTGFEEYFADPPITPEEHTDEQKIYASHNPFSERIEECIQRFRARRRLDNTRAKLFSQYLLLGGINATQRQFTGVADMNELELEGVTNSDMRSYAANDVIDRSGTEAFSRFYREADSDKWDVDFTGVAAGFFSHHLPRACLFDPEEYAIGLEVVHNFLTYVLAHDACPEYKEDIESARKLCHQAAAEFPQCCEAAKLLPGLFNKACQKLFYEAADGSMGFSFFSGQDWLDLDGDDLDAERIFKATIALLDEFKDSEILKKARDLKGILVTETVDMEMEITDIRMPSEDVNKLFAGVKDREGKPGNIPAMGFATMRQCVIENGWDRATPTEKELRKRPTETFVFDVETLSMLEVGFKMQAKVSRLDGGQLSFIHSVGDVVPSFYTFLPQELMLQFKQPALSERPGPSVEDPEIEEAFEMEDLGEEFGEADIGKGDKDKADAGKTDVAKPDLGLKNIL